MMPYEMAVTLRVNNRVREARPAGFASERSPRASGPLRVRKQISSIVTLVTPRSRAAAWAGAHNVGVAAGRWIKTRSELASGAATGGGGPQAWAAGCSENKRRREA